MLGGQAWCSGEVIPLVSRGPGFERHLCNYCRGKALPGKFSPKPHQAWELRALGLFLKSITYLQKQIRHQYYSKPENRIITAKMDSINRESILIIDNINLEV
jgi:hypothetical protein